MSQYQVRRNITLRVRYAPPAGDGTLGADAGKVMQAGDMFDSDQVSQLSGIPWLRITRIVAAADGKVIYPPADKSWWCNGSNLYVTLVSPTPIPEPIPVPVPVVLVSANTNFNVATGKLKTTYIYSDSSTKALES